MVMVFTRYVELNLNEGTHPESAILQNAYTWAWPCSGGAK
jgi:hypothetical protein